jgi:predicted peroxiredoxin
VISNAGLEELLSPLAFVLAAALEGTDVSIYFQGPAVKVVTKRFTPRLHGLNRPFSRFARRGLNKIGHVSPHEKLAELRRLGAHLYVCGPSMQHFKVREDDLIFDDIVVAAYLTFVAVMLRADVHLFVQ